MEKKSLLHVKTLHQCTELCKLGPAKTNSQLFTPAARVATTIAHADDISFAVNLGGINERGSRLMDAIKAQYGPDSESSSTNDDATLVTPQPALRVRKSTRLMQLALKHQKELQLLQKKVDNASKRYKELIGPEFTRVLARPVNLQTAGLIQLRSKVQDVRRKASDCSDQLNSIWDEYLSVEMNETRKAKSTKARDQTKELIEDLLEMCREDLLEIDKHITSLALPPHHSQQYYSQPYY
jgi:hypothetical protein